MKTINRLASFIKADHRYVYLGTSVIAALGLAFSQRNPYAAELLGPPPVSSRIAFWAILWARLVVSAAALVTKLMHWNDYREKVAVRIRAFPSWRAPGQLRRGRHRGEFSLSTAASCHLSTWCR